MMAVMRGMRRKDIKGILGRIRNKRLPVDHFFYCAWYGGGVHIQRVWVNVDFVYYFRYNPKTDIHDIVTKINIGVDLFFDGGRSFDYVYRLFDVEVKEDSRFKELKKIERELEKKARKEGLLSRNGCFRWYKKEKHDKYGGLKIHKTKGEAESWGRARNYRMAMIEHLEKIFEVGLSHLY